MNYMNAEVYVLDLQNWYTSIFLYETEHIQLSV